MGTGLSSVVAAAHLTNATPAIDVTAIRPSRTATVSMLRSHDVDHVSTPAYFKRHRIVMRHLMLGVLHYIIEQLKKKLKKLGVDEYGRPLS